MNKVFGITAPFLFSGETTPEAEDLLPELFLCRRRKILNIRGAVRLRHFGNQKIYFYRTMIDFILFVKLVGSTGETPTRSSDHLTRTEFETFGDQNLVKEK